MNDDTTIQEDGGLPQLDRYLRVLSDGQRRHILYYLDEHHATNLEELTRYVTARETDRSASELSEKEYDPVRIELHHNHLPRLEDYGLVDYDERTKDIRFAEPSQTLSLLVQFVRSIEDRS